MTRSAPDISKSFIIGADSHDVHYLPLDIATESIAIVARKGAGKTHTARIVAEGLIQRHVPVVIIDPLDVWWGIRVSADGKGPGLDVVIFGGSHADLPLLEGAGIPLADLIVDKGISAVLVLDHLSQASQRRFMAAFCTRLYERKSAQEHRTALHMIIDEADAYAPQRVFPDVAACQGAVDRIVRRGRSRGLGTTVITQRPAVLSKDILTQTEILICLQVTGPQDRKALQEWIDANATSEQKATFLAQLPKLLRGEAFIWSPAKLKCFYPCLISMTETFDSSFTPTVGVTAAGKARVSPTLKQLDLTAIRVSLEEVVKEATENDPKVLKGKLRTAEAAIAVLQKERGDSIAARDTVQGRLDEASRRVAQLEQQLASAITIGAGDIADELIETQKETTNALLEKLRQFIEQHPILPLNLPRQVDTANFVMGPGNRSQQIPPEVTRRIVDDLTRGIDRGKPTGMGPTKAREDIKRQYASENQAARDTLPKCEVKILTVLAQGNTSRLSRERVAAIAGYSPGGGGFNNSISALKGKGYIGVEGTELYLTQAGANAIGHVEPLPTGKALLDYWRNRVGKAERAILEALGKSTGTGTGEAYLYKGDIAQLAGYAVTGGGFNNALSALRTKGLITGNKDIALAEDLRS